VSNLLASAGIFAGTDVDDLVVLTVLFLSARTTGRPRPAAIWAGQYAGIAVLIGISVLAALGLTIVPDERVRLLGLIPLALGVWGLVRAIRTGGADEDETPVATGFLSVAGLTVVNGADNLSVYTPTFRALGAGGTLTAVLVFAVGVAVWCLIASRLSSHRAVLAVIERYGHWIVPLVFVAIGVLILAG
jgi:cadmium resistance protein CadD (predicted permease)